MQKLFNKFNDHMRTKFDEHVQPRMDAAPGSDQVQKLKQKFGFGGTSGDFVHPGTLMGPGELDLMRKRVASGQEPWKSAYEKLAKDTPGPDYQPHALKECNIDYGGKGQGHDELVEKDGKVVYMQTVMWLVSGNEGYARSAANIIDAWSRTCTKFVGKNAALEAGWGISSLARSAELLKCTWGGWTPALEAQFLHFIDAVILQPTCLYWVGLATLPLANWHTAIAECKMSIAILKNDRRLFDEAVADWKKVAHAYLKPTGECTETSRDLYHSQFGLGGLIQVAEMAWQQGLDLYSFEEGRLMKTMEFHACITNGGKPSCCQYELKGIGFLPCGWEVGYNHYHGRMGMNMPETEQLLAKNRPEAYVFSWGLGTLTHYGSAEVLFQRCPNYQQQ